MAKAPRRRGRGSPGSKPEKAKPVRPKAVAPAKPVPAKKASPSSKPARGRGRGRISEEEVGGRAGRGRAAGGSGGMGLAGRVGLVAGLLTLVISAAAVLSSSSGGGNDPTAAFDEVGYRLVSELAAMDPGTWIGRTKSTDGYKTFRRNFNKLFGEERAYYFDDWVQQITDTSAWGEMDQEEKEVAQEQLDQYHATKLKLEGGDSGGDGKPTPGAALALDAAVRRQPQDQPSGGQVLAAWIRVGVMKHDGDWVVGSGGMTPERISVAADGWRSPGHSNQYQYADGTYMDSKGQSFEVRVFATAHTTRKYSAYVAMWRGTAAGGGSSGAGLGLGIALMGAIVAGFIASTIAGKHADGIRNLAREIDRLGTSGDPTRQLHAHGAEATSVARAVERMVGHLEFRSKHDDQDLDEVVSKEQKVAEEIHGALMNRNPPSLSGYEVETLFKPGFEIGGDHFEYFDIDETHLGVILLDTNVRGVQAALVMAQAKAYVRAAAPANLSPADVLRHVNRNLAGELPLGRHVTALYAVIDTAEGRATVASAGHLPLIVYRHSEGKVFKVNPEGIALGLDKGTMFDRSLEEGDIPIGIGDRIVLYTDGALMVQNEHAEEFGEQRFYQSVAREAPKNSQAFVNFVGGAIDQFHLNAPQNDDITISTVKRLK